MIFLCDFELENVFEDLLVDHRRNVCACLGDISVLLSCATGSLCLQRYNRRKCAHLLRDLAATAHLPPNSALFFQQLLELTHRWWSEREDNDIDIGDVRHLAAAVYFHLELHSARCPDPGPYQVPDPRQPARPLADLLTAIAALLARRQSHNAPLLHSVRTIQEVLTEEYRILEFVNNELGTHTTAAWRVLAAAVRHEKSSQLISAQEKTQCDVKRRRIKTRHRAIDCMSQVLPGIQKSQNQKRQIWKVFTGCQEEDGGMHRPHLDATSHIIPMPRHWEMDCSQKKMMA